jgi:hypothetical protein
MLLKHCVVSINRSSYLCFLIKKKKKKVGRGGKKKRRKLQRVLSYEGTIPERGGGGVKDERFYRLTSVSSGLFVLSLSFLSVVRFHPPKCVLIQSVTNPCTCILP